MINIKLKTILGNEHSFYIIQGFINEMAIKDINIKITSSLLIIVMLKTTIRCIQPNDGDIFWGVGSVGWGINRKIL